MFVRLIFGFHFKCFILFFIEKYATMAVERHAIYTILHPIFIIYW